MGTMVLVNIDIDSRRCEPWSLKEEILKQRSMVERLENIWQGRLIRQTSWSTSDEYTVRTEETSGRLTIRRVKKQLIFGSTEDDHIRDGLAALRIVSPTEADSPTKDEPATNRDKGDDDTCNKDNIGNKSQKTPPAMRRLRNHNARGNCERFLPYARRTTRSGKK